MITINAYERNPKARARCIAHGGAICAVCGFDFGSVYGTELSGFIHVHHVVPLSTIRHSYRLNAILNRRPSALTRLPSPLPPAPDGCRTPR